MTDKQKARAYDEAIERAEKALEVCGTDKCETARQIFSLFPELKESEDERISKKIKKVLNWYRKSFSEKSLRNEEYDEMFAWLERQGNQNHIEQNLEMVESLRTEYEKGRADAFVQMKKGWSKEDEKVWKELIEEVKDQLDSVPSPDCRDKEDEKALKQLTRWLVWLKSLKERYTWKPSDEQMVVLELASKYERVFTPKQIDILIDLKEQLKKLKGE